MTLVQYNLNSYDDEITSFRKSSISNTTRDIPIIWRAIR